MRTVHPTGTTIYKPDKAYGGYVLTWDGLMDMNGTIVHGNKVHGWNVPPTSAWKVATRLTKEGALITSKEPKALAQQAPVYYHPGLSGGRNLFKYDWDGNLIWTFTVPDNIQPGGIHHAKEIAENGDIAFIVWETLPAKYLEKITDPERKTVEIKTDVLLIVNKEGELIWEWHECEHLDVNTYSLFDGITDWTHTNTIQALPENHWYDEGHKEFRPGNVMFNPRNLDKFFIIDRETKEIVWDYTGTFAGGLAHPHGPLMLEKGLPGAGNIIVFDNGLLPRMSRHGGRTFLLEINPAKKEVVWCYPPTDEEYSTVPFLKIQEEEGSVPNDSQFFSIAGGYCQRLPNGNTLIMESHGGRMFQVTPEAEIVWEWVGSEPVFFKMYPYDYCPQLKAMGKPRELAVTPPRTKDWHLVPDELRVPDTQR